MRRCMVAIGHVLVVGLAAAHVEIPGVLGMRLATVVAYPAATMFVDHIELDNYNLEVPGPPFLP